MTTEKDIEQKVIRLAESRRGEALKFVSPGQRGVPDRILLFPGGLVIFVEVKRPNGGRVSPLQRWWREHLGQLGFWAVIVRDDEDLTTLGIIIDDMLGRRRP